MSSDWISVNGIVTTIATAIDLGYRSLTYQRVRPENPLEVLRRVDRMLEDTRGVIENHRDLMPDSRFNDLMSWYANYYWHMLGESQDHRIRVDELVKRSRILSQLYSRFGSHGQRVYGLLHRVEAFQAAVVVVSTNELNRFRRELKPQIQMIPRPSPMTLTQARQANGRRPGQLVYVLGNLTFNCLKRPKVLQAAEEAAIQVVPQAVLRVVQQAVLQATRQARFLAAH
ncbi:hypothetical protein FRC10_008692 [Ceratobasidium sp. 414]|nr:hypothetical protein FRC10_008692 [Ceratobasidium sp. 414]